MLAVWAGVGSVRGPGRFGEWMMGARLPRGVPGRGTRAAIPARRGESGLAHPVPCPLVPSPGVCARGVAGVEGGRRGVSRAGRRTESGGRQEFLCLRLGRFLALAKWAGGARGSLSRGRGIPWRELSEVDSAPTPEKGNMLYTHRHAPTPPASQLRIPAWGVGTA